MNQEDIDLLEKYGWVVECESPFEIRQKHRYDGTLGFAKGTAAEIVLDHYRAYDERKKQRRK